LFATKRHRYVEIKTQSKLSCVDTDLGAAFKLRQWFSTWESRPPEESWTTFGGVASRYFMCTAV